jgi:ribosomal protein S12 methylthiotransferase accessory factor
VTDLSQDSLAASIHAVVARVVQALNIEEQHRPGDNWPIRTSPFFASARTESSLEFIQGFGSGTTPELARLRAVMECAERYAQFGQVTPSIEVVGRFDSLGQDAISPHACGLYSPRQYATPGFGLQPFSDRTSLEWLAMSDLESGVRRLLPVEFLCPRASLTRPRIVMESSSGTAAHTSPEAATLAALCEVIERDCLLLFWYRRPRTVATTIDALDASGIREDLRRIQARGFVVMVCSLTYDLDVPCFLIVATKGDVLLYGSGCHPAPLQALTHAVTELSQSLRQLMDMPEPTVVARSFFDVSSPSDHYGLFNRGPLHRAFRQMLAQTLCRVDDRTWRTGEMAPMSDAHALASLIQMLVVRGWRPYCYDFTPPCLASCGVHVRRVIVPGLIPMHFGFSRLRLGCRRLWDSQAPGRLSTLMPHFCA